MVPVNDTYAGFRNNVKWESHRGKKHKSGCIPSSSKAVTRQPFKEVLADPMQIQTMSSPTPSTAAEMFAKDNSDRYSELYTPTVEFDELEKEKFDLMNIKIVVYGLTGLMCEKEPVKRKLFGRRSSASAGGTTTDSCGTPGMTGLSGSSISSGDFLSMGDSDCLESTGVPTTAVVSCQKNAISSQTSLETFLPSMPIQRPIANFVNKVKYSASWPSEQTLQQDDSAMDRSSFKIIRCMQQSTFVPGIGAGSNYINQTVELRINLSRGTELLRLGTATLVINGDEEGELTMSIPAKSTLPNMKKSKRKKKNKYGYFSDDQSRRYYLDENATVKIGIQVIPEDTVRFSQEKDKSKREQELKQLLKNDDLKELLRQMGNDNLERAQSIDIKQFDPETLARGSIGTRREQQEQTPVQQPELNASSLFPGFLCGAIQMPKMPTFCAAGPFAHPPAEPEIPMEIHADRDDDKFASLQSIISSVSESTDGSFLDFDD
ncbi:MAG: hypothetical protein SGILL_010792, partial [Bacillariaceae sp.]